MLGKDENKPSLAERLRRLVNTNFSEDGALIKISYLDRTASTTDQELLKKSEPFCCS